jgi:hypothetical protein
MKIKIIACISVAVIVLCGSSIWEGAAAVASGGFPKEGFYVATDSFPKNTIVDITNLENDRSIRAIVASGLATPGLLAVVSGEAAEMLGLQSRSIGRIRMSQPSDPIAFGRFTEGSGGYDSGESFSDPWPDESGLGIASNTEDEWGYEYYYLMDYPEMFIAGELKDNSNLSTADEAADVVEHTVDIVEHEEVNFLAEEKSEIYDYHLTPAEERPPEVVYGIDPESIIPGISVNHDYDYGAGYGIDPESIIPGISRNHDYIADNLPFSAGSELFSSVPLISGLEHGSYYVQLAAFSRAELVQSEISRIDRNYPLTVFNAGSAGSPVYRILLGPLNHGESGAVLQRFKSIGYKDAFIRLAD